MVAHDQRFDGDAGTGHARMQVMKRVHHHADVDPHADDAFEDLAHDDGINPETRNSAGNSWFSYSMQPSSAKSCTLKAKPAEPGRDVALQTLNRFCDTGLGFRVSGTSPCRLRARGAPEDLGLQV